MCLAPWLVRCDDPLLSQVAVPQDAASLQVAADLAALLNTQSGGSSSTRRRRQLFASEAPASHDHAIADSEDHYVALAAAVSWYGTAST